jgi:hypothetical protein
VRRSGPVRRRRRRWCGDVRRGAAGRSPTRPTLGRAGRAGLRRASESIRMDRHCELDIGSAAFNTLGPGRTRLGYRPGLRHGGAEGGGLGAAEAVGPDAAATVGLAADGHPSPSLTLCLSPSLTLSLSVSVCLSVSLSLAWAARGLRVCAGRRPRRGAGEKGAFSGPGRRGRRLSKVGLLELRRVCRDLNHGRSWATS